MTPTAPSACVEESAADHVPRADPQRAGDERLRSGANGLARGTRGRSVVAPALVTGTIWAVLAAVKAILLVQQGLQGGDGVEAWHARQAVPAGLASFIGLLVALPVAVVADRTSRLGAPPAPPLLLHLLGWALFLLVCVGAMLGFRQASMPPLSGSFALSSAQYWLIHLAEATLAYLIALAVFTLFRRLPPREEKAPGAQESATPVRPGAPTPDGVVRLFDGGREVEVIVRELVAVSGGGNYIDLIFRDGSRKLFRSTLNAAQAVLEPIGFRRTHKSWLVLLDAVTGMARTSSGDFRLDIGVGLDASLSRRNRPLLEEICAKPYASDTGSVNRQRKPAAGHAP